MPARPPLPPPRAPAPSTPDASLWQALGGVHAKLASLEVGLAEIRSAQAASHAGTRSQTIQLLIAGVVTCVTAVAGSRVVAPKPEPTQTVIQRSAYDRAIEECRKIQSDADRVQCIVKVAADASGPAPR